MMYHVILAICLVLHMASDVTSQGLGRGLVLSPSLSRRSPASIRDISMVPTQGCVLKCARGYLPGTCLCQDDIFPFLFGATPCKFTRCSKGEVCRMKAGKAACVVITADRASPDVCNLPAQPGPCKAYIQRYFFDRRDGTCKLFIFGGCRGNGNSFATKQECETTCIADVPAVSAGQQAVQDSNNRQPTPVLTRRQMEICQLPEEPGPCFGHMPSFFFNPNSGMCESFVYGGCGGNKNRFETVQACQQACRGTERQSVGSDSVPGTRPSTTRNQHLSSDRECNLPKAPGFCLAYFESFFYNTQTGECEPFVYGGCQGNANRFESRFQCQQKCKSDTVRPNLNAACLQPKKIGRCRARMQRWFFDQDTLSCRQFYYGGCGGNDNNFRSEAACQRRCTPTFASAMEAAALISSTGVQPSGGSGPRPQRCSLPKVTGPCRASMRKYYFNSDTSECQLFVYGGCKGNDNRFNTLEECQTTCAPTHRQQQQALTPVEAQTVPEFLIESLPGFVGVCSQPKVVGRCRAAMPRFYFNKDSRRCESFLYGGCGANRNNFRSYGECMYTCAPSATAQSN